AFTQLERGGIDLVLLDLSLPDAHGLETFTQTKARFPATPIVVLTGHDDHQMALAAVKAGAQDYLTKDSLNADLLGRSISHAIERHRLLAELQALLRRERENAAQLQALDELKNVFLAALAHDLRTPLTVIQGFASALNKQAETLQLPASRDKVGHILR